MTTPTQIREAILRAADHIEGNPGLFKFSQVGFPECGSPGCALGWVGFFLGMMGMRRPDSHRDVADRLGCKGFPEDLTFYHRMVELTGGYDWKKNAALCAKGLRAYADKFHPETETYPEVQAELERIFAGEATARLAMLAGHLSPRTGLAPGLPLL